MEKLKAYIEQELEYYTERVETETGPGGVDPGYDGYLDFCQGKKDALEAVRNWIKGYESENVQTIKL